MYIQAGREYTRGLYTHTSCARARLFESRDFACERATPLSLLPRGRVGGYTRATLKTLVVIWPTTHISSLSLSLVELHPEGACILARACPELSLPRFYIASKLWHFNFCRVAGAAAASARQTAERLFPPHAGPGGAAPTTCAPTRRSEFAAVSSFCLPRYCCRAVLPLECSCSLFVAGVGYR